MEREYDTLDDLFESVLIQEDEVDDVIADDLEDELYGYLEENRKISIFDSEYVLEGELENGN